MKNSADKPIRVLHILETLDRAGIETFLMNIYRSIDRDKVQFDFLTLRTDPHFDYEDEIKALGGRVLRYKRIGSKFIDHTYNICSTLKKQGPYQAVHVHYGNFNGWACFLAWCCRVPVRVSHCHIMVAPLQKDKLKWGYHWLFRKMIGWFSTHRLACSSPCGETLYPPFDFRVIENGTDLARFRYRPEIREKVRRQWQLQEEILILHTGRLEEEKNQLFLIDIAKCLQQRGVRFRMFFLGKGSMQNALKQKAAEAAVTAEVSLLGVRADLPELLQAADIYVMPSTREALGLSAIEAQAAGLPCLLSEAFPPKACVCNTCVLSLQHGAAVWAETLLQMLAGFERKDETAALAEAGFSCEQSAKQLQQIYEEK